MKRLTIITLSLLWCLASVTAAAAATDLYSVLEAGQTGSSFLNAAAEAAYTDSGSGASHGQYALSEEGAASATASAGAYSKYSFTYYLEDNGKASYVGYVYAPTGMLTVGESIYNEPQAMGGYSLNDGSSYYYITGVTDGYDSSYDKKEYITSYYDATLGSWLGVNSDASGTASSIYVADRTQANEYGYAIYNSQPGYFDTSSRAKSYDANGCSLYYFIFNYTNGSGEYYYGYVYLPTYMSSNLLSQYMYTDSDTLGSGTLDGYYYFYSSVSGYSYASYNLKAYVTSYYDLAGGWLGVNQDGSTTASYVYVANRLAADEWGYAIYGSQVQYFSPYSSAIFH
jgi:hypothetical protein